jgi:hypothetical protein
MRPAASSRAWRRSGLHCHQAAAGSPAKRYGDVDAPLAHPAFRGSAAHVRTIGRRSRTGATALAGGRAARSQAGLHRTGAEITELSKLGFIDELGRMDVAVIDFDDDQLDVEFKEV